MNIYLLTGMVGLSTVFINLAILVFCWPLGTAYSFSEHAAQSKKLSIYYFVIFLISLPCLWIYFTYYFVPILQLPHYLSVVFAGAVVFQLLCTLFPIHKHRMVHTILAGASALCMLLVMILASILLGGMSQAITITGTVVMACDLLFSVIFLKKFPLIPQAVYYLAFFIAIPASTYYA